jgi:uncharacterized phosphosugar-binding protein
VAAAGYLDEIEQRIRALRGQLNAIEQAAAVCAGAIAAGGLVHVFGAGHSRMSAEEAYPRIGGVAGFQPVVELAITFFHGVVGPNGLNQALFLERVPEYGRVIFEALHAEPRDATIIISNSAVEPVIIDFATAARQAGLPIVAVTSLEYSARASAQRGGATRLADLADTVIDNGVPVGDALVHLPGLKEPVGPSSSVLSLSVINAIAVETAAKLLERGVDPMVFSTTHLAGEGAKARYDDCVASYRDRLWRRPAPGQAAG